MLNEKKMPIRTKEGILMVIQEAKRKDLQEILDLQYLAYQSEAQLLNNSNIPPLKQTLEELEKEFEIGKILVVIDEHDKIIGSVRFYSQNETLYIGKLIVHPDLQSQGIGTRLLKEIERICPSDRYELFTSSKSTRNIKLYERAGYHIFEEKEVSDNLKFIYLEKTNWNL
jgi:ribosomal protein S18 acetylase RimI-like enzyme